MDLRNVVLAAAVSAVVAAPTAAAVAFVVARVAAPPAAPVPSWQPAPNPPMHPPAPHQPQAQLAPTTMSVPFSEIMGTLPITQTTGGSVWVLTVRRRGGDDFHVVEATSDPSARLKLEEIAKKLAEARTSKGSLDTASAVYHDHMYTDDGDRSGYSAFSSQVTLNWAK